VGDNTIMQGVTMPNMRIETRDDEDPLWSPFSSFLLPDH